MTDQEMIDEYNELDSKYGDIQDTIDDLEVDRDTISDEMNGIADLWEETHECDCLLLGMGSSCEHDKD